MPSTFRMAARLAMSTRDGTPMLTGNRAAKGEGKADKADGLDEKGGVEVALGERARWI